jgi:hypothetical protein
MRIKLADLKKKEDFNDVVKNNSSFANVLKHYGLYHKGGNPVNLKKYLIEWGFDISHYKTKRKWDFKNLENLKEVIKTSSSIKQILDHYGIFSTGGNATEFRKYLNSLSIDIKHLHSSNKGLTKENSARIKKQSETYKKRYKEGKIKTWCEGKSKNNDKRLKKLSDKLSKIVSEKVKNGTWHYSFSKVRTHEYNSKTNGVVKLMGSWELKFAKWLDENNINWKQNKDKFYYEFAELKQGHGYYVPDFYLIDRNEYIEIKGYETEKDRAKWKWFPHKLTVLKREQLTNFPYNLILSDKN